MPCRAGIGGGAQCRAVLLSPPRALGLKRISRPQEGLGIGVVRSRWQLDDCRTSLLSPRRIKNYAPGGWKSGTGLSLDELTGTVAVQRLFRLIYGLPNGRLWERSGVPKRLTVIIIGRLQHRVSILPESCICTNLTNYCTGFQMGNAPFCQIPGPKECPTVRNVI